MTASGSQYREDARCRILRLLHANPETSQRDMARRLGLSLGGVNYCLAALIAAGHVKIDNFRSSAHKRRYAYMLTPTGIAEKAALTGRFLQRKMGEYEALRDEIEAMQREVAEADAGMMAPGLRGAGAGS